MKMSREGAKLSVFAVAVAAVMAFGAITAGQGGPCAPRSRSLAGERRKADGGAPPPIMPVKKPGSGATTA